MSNKRNRKKKGDAPVDGTQTATAEPNVPAEPAAESTTNAADGPPVVPAIPVEEPSAAPVEATVQTNDDSNSTGAVVAESTEAPAMPEPPTLPPVETEEPTGFLRTPGHVPPAPPESQEQPMTATATVPNAAAAPVVQGTPVVSPMQEFAAALGKVKERITTINTAITSDEENRQKEKDAIDAKFDEQMNKLNDEKTSLINELAENGVNWQDNGATHAGTKKTGKRGPKPGSNKAPKSTPATKPGKKPKASGRRGDGPTAGDMIITKVHSAGGTPVPLKELRNYLRSNGKESNVSMETKRLVNDGKLKKKADGFVLGRKG